MTLKEDVFNVEHNIEDLEWIIEASECEKLRSKNTQQPRRG